MSEARLDRVGCFVYEPVKGAVANDLGLPEVPGKVAKARHDRFMRHQQAISLAKQRAKIGTRVTVIVDEGGAKGAIGRSMHDAPEIDGNVILSSRKPLEVGDVVTASVTRADAYDLFASVV